MLSINRKFISNLLIVGMIFAVMASFISVNAAEKSNNENAKKAVGVKQSTPPTQSNVFFQTMSPEELKDSVSLDNFIRQFPDSNEARVAFALRYILLKNDKCHRK